MLAKERTSPIVRNNATVAITDGPYDGPRILQALGS